MRLGSVRPPRLGTLLLLSNLAVLALPLAGLWGLRLYESALVRQTESELVAQAAVLAGAFREALRRATPDAPPPEPPAVPGAAVLSPALRPGLDLARDPVLPPPPAPVAAAEPPDPAAAEAGRQLAPVLRDAQAVTLAALRVTDKRGVIVATTGTDFGLGLDGWEEVRRVLAGEPVVATLRRREVPAADVPGGISRTAGLRVFVALPVATPDGVVGAVVLSRTPSTLGQAAWGKRYELAGLAAALLGAGALLAFGLSRLIARPLGAVVAQARRVARSEAAVVVPLARPGTREVGELSAAIARMAATLEQRAGYIQGFAASVSHEFKTPLAAARASAELLEDHYATMSDGERRHFLGVISASTERLDRLVRRLLDLARADMMRPGEGGVLAGPVLERLAARYRERGLRVSVAADGARAALPEGALEALVANLLDNAAEHAGPGTEVRIEAGSRAGRTWIAVADDGPGITPANRARAFEPFFTTARERGGTGLGLAIVRAIAASAGGAAELVPSERGTQVRVELPGAGGDQGRMATISTRRFAGLRGL